MIDVSLAGMALLLSASPLLLAALLVKITSPGPVLFRQVRIGRDGKPFEVLKLRTMRIDRRNARSGEWPTDCAVRPRIKKTPDHSLLTPVGQVLRKYSVDELPQLINVFRGDMSLVGPRPALPREMELWDEFTKERLNTRPGLTGLGQISDHQDRRVDPYELDVDYVRRRTIRLYLSIIVRTPGSVLRWSNPSRPEAGDS